MKSKSPPTKVYLPLFKCTSHVYDLSSYPVHIMHTHRHTQYVKSDSVPTGRGPDLLMAFCEAKLPLSKRLCFITVEMGEQGFLAPEDQ